MAEDDNSQKTEEPTSRRLGKAFEEGSVPKSTEVASWCLLAAGTLVLAFVAGPLIADLKTNLIGYLEHPQAMDLEANGGEGVALSLALLLAKALALPFGVLIIGALAGHLLQHPPTWSTTPFQFNLEKLSPLKGASRLFGAQGIANFLKALFKLIVIGGASAIVLWPARGLFLTFVGKAPEAILPSAQALSLKVLGAILIAFSFIALADLVFQRIQHHQKLRMTKQEVKDEHKETEGDPKIKAKIRQIRMERAKRRMMQAMPNASVVVTNPTHYAVALRYVEKEAPAPICVAKGVDELALRIRFAAKEHKIPIVENPPLARALFASVEIDQMIPQEHYHAVAEVIGFVLRLKNRGRSPRRAPIAQASRPRIN
jgi:flagellar biosynthesis protein FlhB